MRFSSKSLWKRTALTCVSSWCWRCPSLWMSPSRPPTASPHRRLRWTLWGCTTQASSPRRGSDGRKRRRKLVETTTHCSQCAKLFLLPFYSLINKSHLCSSECQLCDSGLADRPVNKANGAGCPASLNHSVFRAIIGSFVCFMVLRISLLLQQRRK